MRQLARGRSGGAARRIAGCALAFALLAPGLAAGQDAADLTAATAGEADALYRLGDAYERADGVEQDFTVAASYMKLAAERGNATAQYRLGLYHAVGIGRPRDLVQSYKWLTIASANTSDVEAADLAAFYRDAVVSRMTEAEIAGARELAAAFAPVAGAAELPEAAGGTEVAAMGGAAPDILRKLAPRTNCGAVEVVPEAAGGYRLAGYVPRGSAAPLSDEAAAYFASHDVALELTELEPGVCGVLNAVTKGAASMAGEPGIRLLDQRGEAKDTFREHDFLVVDLPGFDGDRFVAIDYFVHDGQVVHLLPNTSYPDNRMSAGVPRHLFDPADGRRAWEVGPPFGRDLLVVFVSERPLYGGQRPLVESTTGYLSFLVDRLASTAPGDDIRVSYRVVATVGN